MRGARARPLRIVDTLLTPRRPGGQPGVRPGQRPPDPGGRHLAAHGRGFGRQARVLRALCALPLQGALRGGGHHARPAEHAGGEGGGAGAGVGGFGMGEVHAGGGGSVFWGSFVFGFFGGGVLF